MVVSVVLVTAMSISTSVCLHDLAVTVTWLVEIGHRAVQSKEVVLVLVGFAHEVQVEGFTVTFMTLVAAKIWDYPTGKTLNEG